MSPRPSIVDFTACPACRKVALRASGDAVHCGACNARYPLIGGIPWLFREPALTLGEWQNRLRLYLEEFRLEHRIASAELGSGGLSPATRARLTLLAQAYAGQVVAVEGLLRPLAIEPLPAPQATMAAFDVRVPRHQDLHSYYLNLHRDWVWGAVENDAARDAVLGAMPSGIAGRVLVLGAGGCRLAYDLHQTGAPAHTVALDINPLLLLAAQELLAGRSVDLYEFPIAPRAASDHAVRRRLSAPAPARQGLELLFADALDAPFADGAFDVVVTPWLIDIVEDEFGSFARRMNRLLRPGGTWINFGSVSFTGLRPALRLGIDEVWELIAAAGFAVTSHSERELPYMRSPVSRHARQETVLTFAARVERAVQAPPPPLVLPAWLQDPRVPVPMTEQLEVTAVASRLQAFALTLINGERSAADIAGFLVEQKLLGPEAALAAVRGLLLRLHEGQLRRPIEG